MKALDEKIKEREPIENTIPERGRKHGLNDFFIFLRSIENTIPERGRKPRRKIAM